MRLYQVPISLYSFKVRLAVAIKGCASIELVAPPGGTYRSREYLALVPAGTVPALISGDLILTESDAIVEYLDDLYGEPRLVHGNAEQKARIRMLSRLVDLRLEPHVRALFPHVAPEVRDAAFVSQVVSRVTDVLALLEGAIDEQGPYVVDTAPSLADCGIAATLTWLDALTPHLFPGADERGAQIAACLHAALSS